MAFCMAQSPSATLITTRLVGPEVGYGILRGSALISSHDTESAQSIWKKTLCPAPGWFYCEKQPMTLKLTMDGPLSGTGQYSSYFPLKSKFSQQHKCRSVYFR